MANRPTEGLRLLRRHLGEAGLSQRALAAKVKRSEPTVSLWLSGENKPDLKSATELERVTGIPVSAWTKIRRTRAA